jgi:hypothetical protein
LSAILKRIFTGIWKPNYLCFDSVAIDLGEQFRFSLVSCVSEVTDQIQFVRAFTAHNLRQLIHLGHLKNTIKLIPKSSLHGVQLVEFAAIYKRSHSRLMSDDSVRPAAQIPFYDYVYE